MNILRGVFILSIILIAWSSFKIYSSRKSFERSIKEWEAQEDTIKKFSNQDNKDGIKTGTASSSKAALGNKAALDSKENVIGEIVFADKIKVPLIEGTSSSDLRRGAGHYANSSIPGVDGNCIVFGHRETAFRYLKNMHVSDIIKINTQNGILEYKVCEIKIVEPDDEYILKYDGYPVLTLVTCYPFNLVGSAPERYVVRAEYVK